ncbi:tetratricopeptide repeat protein [Sorangium sp. So ce1335]|uniref:tetratricopeptide repeat protein n=1 Tax=Sorangium sp. So ce1335 TaxID=3133335 RepID=UPI003F61BE84
MTVQTPEGQVESMTALIARLRAEQGDQPERQLQALLLHELGALEEALGEEPTAARDYLAAFNADPQFREPLEALVRILTRRKSIKNLGKLLDALTRAAATPEERARAFWERAAYLQDHEQNLAAAKEALEEAALSNPEDATPWLELELIAAKEGDLAGRMRAIEARAELATDPTWKGLLFIELADLAAATENVERAYELLDAAAALEGKARFRSQLALEAIARREEDLGALARALEGQAELIADAIDDDASGEANGVPRYMRKPEFAADAWLRAAELTQRAGTGGFASLLERAAERLPQSALLARARIAALEAAGEAEAAASLAKQEIARGASGPGAAALWLRIAEAAALASDREAALAALRSALAADPQCIPARALEIDLLGDGQDPSAFAASLEATAASYTSEEARGRALLLAAYVWAVRTDDVPAAKSALSQAGMAGVHPGVLARFGRSFAALRGDAAWYEESTKRLLSTGVDPAEKASLWFEIGRSRLLRGDADGAEGAFAQLAAAGAEDGGAAPNAWLGRALGAFAVDLVRGRREPGDDPGAAPRRSPTVIEALAEVEGEETARGLWLVAALRSARSGELDRARTRLRALFERSADDQVVAVFLAELDRRAGSPASAAATLSTCAAAIDDADLSAAMHIEAAILLWRAGERGRAVDELEAARGKAPRAGATVLTWALRGHEANDLHSRRRALEVAGEAGEDPAALALSRFGLEVGAAEGGDPDEALATLEALESQASDDLALAAALGRLLWQPALEQRSAVERALDYIEERGAGAASIAHAERFRLTRTLDQDRARAAARAAAWAAVDPSPHADLEWLGAALGAEDREAEVAARSALARHMEGEARAAMEASAAIVGALDQPNLPRPFLSGEYAPAQLANLELALPGCDPRRRAAALHGLGDALGEEAQLTALGLAGWSDFAAGDHERARAAFRTVVERRPDDIAAWEGVRATSEALRDPVSTALAAAQLGALCKDDARGAEFWESAGLLLLEHTEAHDDAEIAFDRAFARDPRRGVAFDRLFRRVRARNEDNRLLDIIERRLGVADSDLEICKLFWERARVLRKKGKLDEALAALENVTLLEPDHIGALALSADISKAQGDLGQAAAFYAELSRVAKAPGEQRLMSGITAVDAYEKLGEHDRALDVLVGLHRAGLSTLPVRERLVRVAARVGSWEEATRLLEELMVERDTPAGRVEAARLAMAIYRDQLRAPRRAEKAVAKLLEEAPDDGEAIDLVLTTDYDPAFRTRVLGRAKATLIQALASDPIDADRVALLAKIAGAGQDAPLRQATLGALVALGRCDEGISAELRKIDTRVPARPQIALDARAMAEIADPLDTGPVGELFAKMAETICMALGPSLVSLGVGKKDRIDARGGHPLRVAVAEWMGALSFETDFELYVGGPNPRGATGVYGQIPALVLGSEITTPLDAASRSAIAREAFALRRGITSLRTRDDNTVASLVAAACIEAGIAVPHPPYAVFGEVSRSIHREMSRATRKAIAEVCQRIVSSQQDPHRWAQAARRSIDRMAVIAAGDVSLVLSDILNTPREQLGGVVAESERARQLVAFVLSQSYLELRKKLGMGVR